MVMLWGCCFFLWPIYVSICFIDDSLEVWNLLIYLLMFFGNSGYKTQRYLKVQHPKKVAGLQDKPMGRNHSLPSRVRSVFKLPGYRWFIWNHIEAVLLAANLRESCHISYQAENVESIREDFLWLSWIPLWFRRFRSGEVGVSSTIKCYRITPPQQTRRWTASAQLQIFIQPNNAAKNLHSLHLFSLQSVFV